MAVPHNRGIEDEICKTLKWMRHKAEVRPVDLVERLGVSRTTIWYWENGENFPESLVMLRKWANAVGAKLEIKLTTKLVGRDGKTEFTF